MAIDLFNGTRPENLITYVNTSSEGIFGWLILLVIFLASYVGLSFLRSEQSFAGAAFLTGIMATIFYAMGAINTLVLFLAGLMIMISLVVLKVSQRI